MYGAIVKTEFSRKSVTKMPQNFFLPSVSDILWVTPAIFQRQQQSWGESELGYMVKEPAREQGRAWYRKA